ncbi:hypothetical protein SEVIR_8G125932v4 [Setaria viridis]|uniref:Uncharacterized protein n=1 Tax=Setaria viridis TaxID=4556 RepID=A0A4U6TSR5_SETVI|nr:hypothetical protein SEVIR_8G125932v2 [Setaria viridis]
MTHQGRALMATPTSERAKARPPAEPVEQGGPDEQDGQTAGGRARGVFSPQDIQADGGGSCDVSATGAEEQAGSHGAVGNGRPRKLEGGDRENDAEAGVVRADEQARILDHVFSKGRQHQVIFRGTYWTRTWAVLSKEEEKNEMKNNCSRLEGTALEFFSNKYGWNFRRRILQ